MSAESIIAKMKSWLADADARAEDDKARGGHTRVLAFPADDVRALLAHIDSESTRMVSTGYPRMDDKLTGGTLRKRKARICERGDATVAEGCGFPNCDCPEVEVPANADVGV